MAVNESRIFSNIERFIHEVSIRTCLWNRNCPEYKIRTKRKEAWEEICNIFFSNFNSKNSDRKEHLCLLLQKKWKTLRDTYVRDLRKNKRMRYAHFNSLSFLNESITSHKPLEPKMETIEENNGDNTSEPYKQQEIKEIYQDEYESVDEQEEDQEIEEKMIFKNKSYLYSHNTYQNSNTNDDIDNIEYEMLDEHNCDPLTKENLCTNTISSTKNTLTTANNSNFSLEDDDEDRLFLLSLVKDLKKIPEHNKLAAKSDILLVLNKWQKSNEQIYYAAEF